MKDADDGARESIHAPLFFVLIIAWVVSLAPFAHARAEYALQNSIVNCTACHIGPTGGGIRNVAGKQFGLHGFPPGPHSARDLYQVDLRALGLLQEYPKDNRDGLGLMELLAAVNVPLSSAESGERDIRLVAANNFGGFTSGLREAYLRWETRWPSPSPQYILFGKFFSPFGILTDEHRTYVRIQSKTTHNDFQMGGLVAGEALPSLHYDLAIVNGFQNTSAEGGGQLSQGVTSGVIANARWLPGLKQYLFGGSLSYFKRHSEKPDPTAYSVYGGLSLGSWIVDQMPTTILLEASLAKNWNDAEINPELQRVFLPSAHPQFASLIRGDTSLGWLGQLLMPLSDRWVAVYKFEHLDLSMDESADAFTRHGVGFKYFSTRFLTLQARYEFADSSVVGLSKQNVAAQDTFWLLAHAWF